MILVRLSPIQRALYTEFMKRFREAGNNGWLGLNPLKAFCVCCKVKPFSLLLVRKLNNASILFLEMSPEDHFVVTIKMLT